MPQSPSWTRKSQSHPTAWSVGLQPAALFTGDEKGVSFQPRRAVKIRPGLIYNNVFFFTLQKALKNVVRSNKKIHRNTGLFKL